MTMNCPPARAWRAFATLLIYGLSACAQQSLVTPVEPAMNTNPLLTDLRPWCVGRFMIDRPAQSRVSSEDYEFDGDKITVTRNVTPETFRHTVDARERELKTSKRTIVGSKNPKTNIPWLERSASPNANSRLFIYKMFGSPPVNLPFEGEGYILAGRTMLNTKFLLGHNTDSVQPAIESESRWYRTVTYRDDWTVPTERGFCIEGALIGESSYKSEEAEQFINLLSSHYSLFNIHMRESVDVDQNASLLKDLPALRQKLRDSGYGHNISVLREGKRQIAGMDAEEVLFSIRDGQIQMFRFYLLAPGVDGSLAHPHTAIQLMLGDSPPDKDKHPVSEMTSPVDEAGAIQAWDTLLNSLRLRPGAM